MQLLESPTLQYARLCIYSQGYLAKSIRIGGYRDKLWSMWNAVAYKINRQFETTKEGIVWAPKIVPQAQVIHTNLMYFIQALQRKTP
ncbi:MAG: hypothetical protein WD847_15690 [Pirellulales bacterium]